MKFLWWILQRLGAIWTFFVGEEYDPNEESEEAGYVRQKRRLAGRDDTIT